MKLYKRSRIPVIACMICLVLGTVGLVYSKDSNGATGLAYKATAAEEIRYETVVVKRGDTVWDIAGKYNDGTKDNRVIVKQISTLNAIESGKIYPGQTIQVPVNGY
jgi:LysM repeat protein